MSKYIDADKLIAEIKRRMEADVKECHTRKHLSLLLVGRVNAHENLIPFIESLQQEQPASGCSEKPNNLLSE